MSEINRQLGYSRTTIRTNDIPVKLKSEFDKLDKKLTPEIEKFINKNKK